MYIPRGKADRAFWFISIALFSIAAFIIVFYMVKALIESGSIFPIGANMVSTEFPPEAPFYAKPVTYFVFSLVLGWLFGLESMKERISMMPSGYRRLALVLSIFIIFMAGYEVLYNFTLWGALMTWAKMGGYFNPDVLINPFPSEEAAWNITFATKVYTSIFFMAIITAIYLVRADKTLEAMRELEGVQRSNIKRPKREGRRGQRS
jgi:hypothetical protein